MPRQRRPRHRVPGRELSFPLLVLLGLGVGAGLSSIAMYIGSAPLPGRPVEQVASSQLSYLIKVLVFVLGIPASFIAAYRLERTIGLISAILFALVLLNQWWAPLLASVLLLSLTRYWLEVGIASALLPAVLLVSRPLSDRLAGLGAIIGFGEALVALVLGVLVALSTMFVRPRSMRSIFAEKKPNNMGLAVLGVAIIFSILAVLIPHISYGFSKIISYDTYYNIKFCSFYREGDYMKAFFSWQRPLYTLLVTTPAALMNCKPWFFDVIVPATGFVLLALISWLLLLRSTGSSFIAGFGSLLAIAYWIPFFLYAGLQTNLLALPVALYLAYILLNDKEERQRVIGVALSVFLGLWHPWTLAYYSVAIVLSVLAARLSIVERMKYVLYSILPGWVAYALVVVVAGRSGVIAVARGGVSKSMPLLWNLKIYFWGVVIRPDILLPIVLALASTYLVTRERTLPLWLLGATSLGLLGILLPNSKLLVRFLVDAPFPLLLAILSQKSRYSSKTLILASMVSLVTLLYFIESIRPVIEFPH